MKIEQLKHLLPLDLETTGLDPIKNGMISMGVSLFNGEELYQENYLRSDVEIHPAALKVNGETEENLKSRSYLTHKSEIETLESLVTFSEINQTKVIIGKNPKFDYNFLLEIWKRNGNSECNFPFTYRVINYADLAIPLMILSGITVPVNGFSSSDIQNFLGLEEEPKPHNALTGARYNADCFKKIIEKYESRYKSA